MLEIDLTSESVYLDLKTNNDILMFSLNVFEVNLDYMPSIKVFLKCQLKHPTGVFYYEASDIYFELDEIYNFNNKIETMFKSENEYALLKCMSSDIQLRISRNLDEVKIEITIQEIQANNENIKLHAKIITNFSFLNEASFRFVEFLATLRQIVSQATKA